MYFSILLNKFSDFIRKILYFLDDMTTSFTRDKKRTILFLSLVAFIFGCGALIINVKTPMVLDDFAYSSAVRYNTGFLQTVLDIVDFQYDHYFGWGGRTIAHVIAQLLLWVNPLTADVLNSLAYVLYAFFIYYHIIARGKHSIGLLVLVNSLVWIVQPNIGETLLWLTGSANYLWCTVIILLFLFFYRLYNNNGARYTFPKCIGIFILGIITGWTNENTVTGLIIIVILFILYYKANRWKIPLWSIIGLIGLVIGYIILIKAPGNIVRSTTIGDEFPVPLSRVMLNFIAYTKETVKTLGSLNLLGLICLILLLSNSQDKVLNKKIVFLYLTYLIGALVSVYVMIFSPQFPPRAWFGLVTFNIISLGIIFNSLNSQIVVLRRIKQSVVLFSVLLFTALYIEGFFDVNRINNIWNERKEIIEKNSASQTPCIFENLESRSKFGTSDTEFLAPAISAYYETPIDIVY